MAPTISIETINMVRPLKVVSVMCALIATLLLLLTVANSSWLYAGNIKEGLWSLCIYVNTSTVICENNDARGWIYACRAFSLMSMIICLLSVVFTSIGLNSLTSKRKYTMYKVGLVLMFSAFVCLLIPLIIFPVKFLEEYTKHHGWNIGWAYITGWISGLFMFASAILLCVDRGTEEIVYMEKTTSPEDEDDDA